MVSLTAPEKVLPDNISLEQLALLQLMVEEISGELALEPLLTRIVERACKLIGADDGTIALYDAERDLMRTAVVYHMPKHELNAEMRRGEGLAGLVLASGKPIRCRYGDVPHPTSGEPADNFVIGMPIRVHDRIIGVFGIGVWPPRRLDKNHQLLLGQFARHAAVAIQNARRYAEEQRRAARFALIARVANTIAEGIDLDDVIQRAADAVHEMLGFPNVAIPLLDPHAPAVLIIKARGGRYKDLIRFGDRLPIDRGIMGASVRERRTQLVNDVAADARYLLPPGVDAPTAELAIPIVDRDEVLGVLNVEGDRPFDELDRISLEVMAEYLAMAIRNARLFERSRQLAVMEERQRLARDLHDNVTQILSSISLMAQSVVAAGVEDPAEALRRSGRIAELAQMAFAEMRALLEELKPPQDPTHQPAAAPITRESLDTMLRRVLGAMVPHGIALELDLRAYRPQAPLLENTICRICQESVSNAIRHAGAKRIEVSVRLLKHKARVVIADDGCGIRADAAHGMGIPNMHNRLHDLGGVLRITAGKPRGTRVEADIPRADRSSEK